MQSEQEAQLPKATPRPTKAERELAVRQRDIQLDKAQRVATESTSIFDPIAFAQMKQLAADLIAGGAGTKDADTPEKMLVKLQAGFELGMKPIESGNSLYIVNGRVTIWGAALIGRLRKFGWQVSYQDETETSCTIVVRKGDEMLDDTFLYQDAVDSGYTVDSYGKEKIGWKKGQNRKLKMRYGAAAQLAKTYLSEVLGSVAGVTEIDQDAPLIVDAIEETIEERKARVSDALATFKATHDSDEADFTPRAVTADGE